MATAVDNTLENLRVRFRRSQLGAFADWWIGELRDMLPERLQAGMSHARRRVAIRLDGEDLSVMVCESARLQELEVFSTAQDARLQQQRLSDLLAERELNEVSRDFLLPETRVLRKRVTLPAAAEGNLRQALAFEMDRQTPFRVEDVFFDYRILERDRENGQLKLELVVTQKQPLLRDLQTIEPFGLAPAGVDVEVDGSPLGFNLLPRDMRQRIVNSKSRANRVLGVALFVLLLLVMAQSIWLRQHQLSEVRAAIDEVREEALQVQQIRDRINDAAEAAGFLYQRRASAPPTVDVLAEVTRILPDDTYLDRLLISADSVQMQGKSDNAQRLIELVNESPMMTDAAFRGSTRLDTRSRKEIFDINAALLDGGSD